MNGFTASIRLAADGVAWFVGLVSNHMGLVKNILLGVGIVLGVLAAQMIVTWVAVAWPILAVIAAIALVITALNKLGVSTQTIVGVVAGLFGMLFAFLWNKVAYLWNVILSFAEFFVNVFIDPVYAVQKLFYDLSKDFLGHLYNMVRGAEDFSSSFSKTMLEGINLAIQGFNWMIDAINKIPGFKIEPAKLLDENNVHTVSDSLKNMMDQLEKPTTDKNVVDFSKYKMQEKSMGAAFNSGMEYGTGLFATMSNAMDGLKEKGDAWSTIDKVNEIGKIKDKVDISSEDLKVMRELAEMKNIQNFVTLTPTVQVTTGDINHPTSVDEIIRQIEDAMVKEVANSAQGMY
ncbi:hypothetical protein ACHHV8_25445 [Paenibacillus sp. TAB 01]|uniref:hypothetical protein n=1 Tax=Paenibacillus sp. TAB 01 TaxID=3368988 RepID=UPI00375140EF